MHAVAYNKSVCLEPPSNLKSKVTFYKFSFFYLIFGIWFKLLDYLTIYYFSVWFTEWFSYYDCSIGSYIYTCLVGCKFDFFIFEYMIYF